MKRELPLIENGDTTIIISKQQFANTIAKISADFVNVLGPEMIPMFARFCARITCELFDSDDPEDDDDE